MAKQDTNQNVLINRIQKNLKRLKSAIRNGQLECYRLYDHDIPEYPLQIEAFGQYLVVWLYADETKDNRVELLKEIHLLGDWLKTLNFSEMIIKDRFAQTREQKYQKKEKSQLIDVREGPLVYEVELRRYLDTGLFLDHRILRRWLQTSSAKSMLNLFSYTGSLGLSCAYAGAETTNVDLSNTYMRWARRNYQKNGFARGHRFVTSDALKFLKEDSHQYDIIVLDPPTFSNSKKTASSFDVQRDHTEMIEWGLRRLNPKGTLYFSTNRKKFQLNLPAHAEDSRLFRVQDKTRQSIPPDFHRQSVHRLWEISGR